MDLSEFVKSSLVQIIRGVSDAIAETQNDPSRAVINPSLERSTHSNPKEVIFDVAVTVQEENGMKGAGGIKVFGAEIGIDGGKKLSNTAVSRLTFSIPVAWPSVAQKQFPNNDKSIIVKGFDPLSS